jgi:hypothetical protein
MENLEVIDNLLTKLQGIETIAEVGLERKSDLSKVDYLVSFIDGECVKAHSPQIINLLKKNFLDIHLEVIDDCVRFKIKNFSGGIAVCNLNNKINTIENYIKGNNLEGELRNWVLGSWLPESFLGDIASSRIILDSNNKLKNIVKNLNPYPDILVTHIGNYCREELKLKIQLYKKINNQQIIEKSICLSSIANSVVRLSFSKSKKYLRGFNNLNIQKQTLNQFSLEMISNLEDFINSKISIEDYSKLVEKY